MPTGVLSDIAPSGVFALEDRCKQSTEQELQCHWENWRSAEDDPLTVAQLLQAEVQAGFAEIWPGSYDDLLHEFNGEVAIGKLGVAYKVRHAFLSEHASSPNLRTVPCAPGGQQ